jgi:hypothetical protein
MYTYTVSLPDNSKSLSSLKSYLKTLGGAVIEKKATAKTNLQEALEDVEKGNLIHCENYDDYIRKTEKFRN